MKRHIVGLMCASICFRSAISLTPTAASDADLKIITDAVMVSAQADAQNYTLTKQLLINTDQILGLCKKQIEAIKKRFQQKSDAPSYTQQRILEGQTRIKLVTAQLEDAQDAYKNTGRAIVQYLANSDLYPIQQRNSKGTAIITQYQVDFSHLAQIVSKIMHVVALHAHLYADVTRDTNGKIKLLADELWPLAQLLGQQTKIVQQIGQHLEQTTNELHTKWSISDTTAQSLATQIHLIAQIEKTTQQLRNEIASCAQTIDRCRRGLCAIQVMVPSGADTKTAQIGYSGLVKYLEEHIVADLADKYRQLRTLQKALPSRTNKQNIDANSLAALHRSAKKIADKIEPTIKNLRAYLSSLATIGSLDTAAYALAENLRQKNEPSLSAVLTWLKSPEYANAIGTLSSHGLRSGLVSVNHAHDLNADVQQDLFDAHETMGVITRALAILAGNHP